MRRSTFPGACHLQGGDTPEQFAATIFDMPSPAPSSPPTRSSSSSSTSTSSAARPDAAGLATWLGVLSGATRADVVAKFLDSPESDGRGSSGQSGIIRGVVSSTKDNDIAFLQAGASQLNLAVGNFASSAFVARANATVT